MRRKRRSLERLFYWPLVVFALGAALMPRVWAAGPALTTINDTVYRADGKPAGGTVLIAWPAFQTAEAVANREIVDEVHFRDGLSDIVNGTVKCLNASVWAQRKVGGGI
jgi:hypothetical protein